MCTKLSRNGYDVVNWKIMVSSVSLMKVVVYNLHNYVLFFFFFQAEDGIRDVAVTGVQTCALPICLRGAHLRERPQEWPDDELARLLVRVGQRQQNPDLHDPQGCQMDGRQAVDGRSEERRVGKE